MEFSHAPYLILASQPNDACWDIFALTIKTSYLQLHLAEVKIISEMEQFESKYGRNCRSVRVVVMVRIRVQKKESSGSVGCSSSIRMHSLACENYAMPCGAWVFTAVAWLLSISRCSCSIYISPASLPHSANSAKRLRLFFSCADANRPLVARLNIRFRASHPWR